MKYTGPIYRPPYEAGSLLLQVTVGCAHNKCTYCTMYRDTTFNVEDINQVKEDLGEAKAIHGDRLKRVFLVNGDAFVLSAKKLKIISEMIIEHFPNIETITMYASINNIKAKTDVELRELRQLRINQLWIGVETGNKDTLEYFNKGFTLDDSYTQLKRLGDANIEHIGIYMYGTGGENRGLEHARDTARLINETKPVGVAMTTLGAFGGSPLSKDVENGKFKPATEREVLEEQKELLKSINIETTYLGIHGINTVAFDAILPSEREKYITEIDNTINQLDSDFLDSVPKRNSI